MNFGTPKPFLIQKKAKHIETNDLKQEGQSRVLGWNLAFIILIPSTSQRSKVLKIDMRCQQNSKGHSLYTTRSARIAYFIVVTRKRRNLPKTKTTMRFFIFQISLLIYLFLKYKAKRNEPLYGREFTPNGHQLMYR